MCNTLHWLKNTIESEALYTHSQNWCKVVKKEKKTEERKSFTLQLTTNHIQTINFTVLQNVVCSDLYYIMNSFLARKPLYISACEECVDGVCVITKTSEAGQWITLNYSNRQRPYSAFTGHTSGHTSTPLSAFSQKVLALKKKKILFSSQRQKSNFEVFYPSYPRSAELYSLMWARGNHLVQPAG